MLAWFGRTSTPSDPPPPQTRSPAGLCQQQADGGVGASPLGMGVKGLAAWLREEPQRRLFASERRHISTSDHRRGSRQVDFVFDLHALALYAPIRGLDRSKGGDYAELSIAARAVFRTIRHVGVRPVVVASGWRMERNALSFDPEVVDLRSDAVDDKLAARNLRRQAHYFAMDAACRPAEAAARKNSGGNPSWNSNKTVMPLFGEQIIRDVAEQRGRSAGWTARRPPRRVDCSQPRRVCGDQRLRHPVFLRRQRPPRL